MHAESFRFNIEMIIFIVFASVLFLLYRHWDDKQHYWSRRGISGPSPEFFFGNLRALRDHDSPRSLVIRDWTRQYGKVHGMHDGYRKVLVVSDLAMITELLVTKFDHFTARTLMPMQDERDTPRTNIVAARGAHWKKLRALASYAFTNKAIKQSKQTVENSCLTMIAELKKREGEVNMLTFYQEFTLDVICKLALGQKDAQMFANPIMEMCRRIFYSPQNGLLTTLLQTVPVFKRPLLFLLQQLARLSSFSTLRTDVERAINERKRARESGSPSSGDFIDIFLDAEVDAAELLEEHDAKANRKLVFEEIVAQCVVMLLAGFETTANSLAYLTHFLATHRDVQERIRDEIDAACTSQVIEYDELAELRYTEAAIKESLRHYPLASFIVSRECEKATTLGGMQLEVGDSVLTDAWSMHMDTEIWGPDAAEFRPERWLEDAAPSRTAFLSFGEGPRLCVGKRLAMMEMKVMMVHLLRNFDVRATENTSPLRLVGTLTVAPERVNVILKQRQKRF